MTFIFGILNKDNTNKLVYRKMDYKDPITFMYFHANDLDSFGPQEPI